MSDKLADFESKRSPDSDLSYRCRSWTFGSELVWRLGPDALSCDEPPGWRIAFGDIRRISLFGVPGLQYFGSTFTPVGDACRVKAKGGRSAILSSTHVLKMGRFEDRSKTYRPFVDALLHRAVAANPNFVIRTGWPRYLWWIWVGVLILYVCLVLFAFAGFVYAATVIGGGLGSGDHSEVTFTNVADGIMFLVAAVIFGAAVPGVVRVLERERCREGRASEMLAQH